MRLSPASMRFAPTLILLVSLTACGGGGGSPTPSIPVLASLNQASLSFGNVQIGSSSTIQTVVLTNTSTAALTVSPPVSNDSNYVVSASTCTAPLPAGSTCSFGVTFTPVTGGVNAAATVSIATPGGATLQLPVSGNGWSITGFTGPTTLSYYHYGVFSVTGSGLLGLGLKLSDSGQKCTGSSTDPTVTATDTALTLRCAVLASGALTVDLADSAGAVIRNSSAYTVPDPKVRIATTMGNMDVLLNPTAAPATVQNFMRYVTYTDINNPTGYYSNTIFHRVINNFMIQGGGFTTGPVQKGTFAAIALESNNGLKNLRGTIAMARTSAANSATSQFFINHVNNASLDYTATNASPNGYAVFGTIVASDTTSLGTLDAIAGVATHTVGTYANVPVTDVTITSVTQIQ